ncbi:MAG TPA: DUF2970 domain-containing protein [Burkholderiales bacterium]|jgi:hypothetical protein
MEDAMKNASFFDSVKTVLAGFIGVRRRSDHEAARIRPAHIIVIAVVFVVLFILTLRTIVGIVTG